MGSKNKMAHIIVPIIQQIALLENIDTYYEPFVGGGSIAENLVEKSTFNNMYCSDLRPELIAFYDYIKHGGEIEYKPITKEHYIDVRNNQRNGKYQLWYVFFIGHFYSYRTMWFGSTTQDTEYNIKCRINSFNNNSKHLIRKIKFQCLSYDKVDIKSHSCIYSDSPYRGTYSSYNNCEKGYRAHSYKSEKVFDFDKYYDWLRQVSKNNFVLISEYTMPPDFKIIDKFKYNKCYSKHGDVEVDDVECTELLWVHKDGWLVDKYYSNKELTDF